MPHSHARMQELDDQFKNEKQFGDLTVVKSDLGIDIFDSEGKKICFFNKQGSESLAEFIS